jgi:hypothetical protein
LRFPRLSSAILTDAIAFDDHPALRSRIRSVRVTAPKGKRTTSPGTVGVSARRGLGISRITSAIWVTMRRALGAVTFGFAARDLRRAFAESPGRLPQAAFAWPQAPHSEPGFSRTKSSTSAARSPDFSGRTRFELLAHAIASSAVECEQSSDPVRGSAT